MKLERTFDVELVKSVICHPEIAPLILEGEAIVPIHESIYYLMARANDVVIGIVAFVPINSITWNPHIAILPVARGMGTDVMKLGVRWIFDNTVCRKIVAYPPAYNKAMIRVFEKCAFKQEGLSPKSFLFNSVLHDRLLFGIEKE